MRQRSLLYGRMHGKELELPEEWTIRQGNSEKLDEHGFLRKSRVVAGE
jgi:hypothetical protein